MVTYDVPPNHMVSHLPLYDFASHFMTSQLTLYDSLAYLVSCPPLPYNMYQ